MFRGDVEPIVGTLTVGENAAGPVCDVLPKALLPNGLSLRRADIRARRRER